MRLPAVCVVLAAATLLSSCADPPKPQPFQVLFVVESDPGRPLAGVGLSRAGKNLGSTDANGRVQLSLNGADGETVDILVGCPEGFQAPSKPSTVRLARIAEKGKLPEYKVACPPTMRRVVIAVRAENGPNLPVTYLGRAVTQTDSGGAAHFALEVAPGAQFQVVLDTAARKDLKPQSPPRVFVVGHQDEILLFDQKFEVERQRVFIPRASNTPRALN